MRKCVALLASAVMLFVTSGIAAAQSDASCADAAGTGYQVCNEFRAIWEGAGPALIGNPLSNEFSELQFESGVTYSVQYFDLQRFELHPDKTGTPYAVLLGRLGVEVLGQMGYDWTAFPSDDPNTPDYQAATGFAIAPEFTDFWAGHGLDFGDPGVSFRESLALFGYPISPARTETDGNADPVLTQWFERARFELRAGEVVLGPLGAEELDVPGVSDPVVASALSQVRRSVAAYRDLDVAQTSGWVLVDGLDYCFANPDVGDMGIHYINTNLLDTALNPLQPEAMVYQPGPDGELSLGAVEWIVPAEAWDAASPDQLPVVLDHELHLNEALGVYVLHAWIFLENSSGVFEDWNPDVLCPS